MGEPVDLVGSDAKVRSAEMTTGTDAAVPDRAEAPKAVQPEGDVPYLTSDHWTGELEGLWTETDPRTAADTAIDMDSVYGTDIRTETDTKAVEQQPMRYEDALKAYLRGDMRFSAKPDVQTGSPDAAPNADLAAVPDLTQETAPKPKEQIISELAPKIQKPGTTPGRAMLAAEQTYADAEKRFGPDAQIVLEQLQPGQDPRRFLDGFQNAYFAGKMGSRDALNESGVAAYLTEDQRAAAFRRGRAEGAEKQNVVSFGSNADTETISEHNNEWYKTLKGSQRPGNREMFRKEEDQKSSFRPISQKRFHDLTIEVRKKGAIIMRATPEVERHLEAAGATASTIGDVLLFKKEVCISEVMEETYHFMQNLRGENADKGEPLRTILNEISAKRYILDNAIKYNVPRDEIEHIKRQLGGYIKQLDELMGSGG